MKIRQAVWAGLFIAGLAASQNAAADPHRLGVGVRYNKAVKFVDQRFDDSKLSYLITYQFVPGIVKLEGDWEFVPNAGEGSGLVSVPQLYAFLGDMIYGGLGIAWYYANSEFSRDPFYYVRAGVDLPFGDWHLDINANYAFENSEQWKTMSADYLQLALMVRREF